jgi:hypothetical protein
VLGATAGIVTSVTMLALASPGMQPTVGCATHVVTKGKVAYPHERTIQAAVNRAKPCDWIMVGPGIYPESVVIRTPNLHLRGLDRNRVVVDGRHRRSVNGIEVRASDVWVENLTVRNFDRATANGENGNQVWWHGAGGWHGNYLTVYDTGLLGGYGLFAEGSVSGEWGHVYASGFDDSGLYIGSCRDCLATVSHALAERNPVGYAGTNSGGHLVLEDSLFRNDAVGISLNSSESDPPPPQLGTCDAGANRRPMPTITSTAIGRCTIVRRNRFVSNNNLTVPSNTSSERPGWGIGIVLLGAYGDLVTGNVLAGNRNAGILGLEFPWWRPARRRALHFQLAGNRIERNAISGSRLGIAIEGGVFGSKRSVDNCFSENRYRRSLPVDLRPFACTKATTPNPGTAANRRILRLVGTLHREFLARRAHEQPAPPPQPTMTNPCSGAPSNPLCHAASESGSGANRPAAKRTGPAAALTDRAASGSASSCRGVQCSPYSSRSRPGRRPAVASRCAGTSTRIGAGRSAAWTTAATARAGSVTVSVGPPSSAAKYSRKSASVRGITRAGVPKSSATSAISR